MRVSIIYIFTGVLLFMMSGCASKKPTHMDLTITSHKELNQDKKSVSSPLMLLFYELESAEKFSKFDYWELLDNNGENLKSDLLSQNKHIILPNQQQVYQIVFDERTKFLGVIGKFRDLKHSNWRHVISLNKGEHNEIQLKVKDYTILEEE